ARLGPLLIGTDPCASQAGDRSCLMKAKQICTFLAHQNPPRHSSFGSTPLDHPCPF
ncbi:unnamed protein product, partial [Pylaiella littoralis]